ncbi:phosphoribosylglycinamide formyltransferase [Salinisphaera sp.]|uniref:phosphoribosylglycinamide formyltransferase n=1 Tax=Salinisphaera sp. TaxID=1914330 RepID=UPI000C3F07C9|nr:phosphoribosylglycinamide formyltransferase [Salinisphaera sp.]MBS63212.1 phosphoribosylglycinamide formyltransferase [Salinisphaera sp.]
MSSQTEKPGEHTSRLVVVISGRGRNLQAIIQAIEAGKLDAEIALVISNRADAPGMQIARLAGLNCVCIEAGGFKHREDFDRALAARIAAARPDWVVLAGFMRILSQAFVERFEAKLINIHPSLLPRYKGLNTHERALSNGDARHGASVHFVTPDLDDGPTIRQGSIAVAADDTPETLAERVMTEVEQRLYPAVLAELVAGRVFFKDGVVWRDQRLQEDCPHDEYDQIALS